MDWEAKKAALIAIGEEQRQELLGRVPLLLETVVREEDPETAEIIGAFEDGSSARL